MNKPMVPPFVWIRSHPYLIANWQPELCAEDWLVLRPLSIVERQLLLEMEDVGFIELFYGIMGQETEEKRLLSALDDEILPTP